MGGRIRKTLSKSAVIGHRELWDLPWRGLYGTRCFELRSSDILEPWVQTRGKYSQHEFESRSDGIQERIRQNHGRKNNKKPRMDAN